jgi:hypothetical protein
VSDHVAALCSYVAALAVLAAWRPERRRVLAGVAATAVVVAVLGAARAAQLHDLRLDNHPYRSIVTREVRMWKTVRARTEPGSLVFVSNRFGIARRGTDRWYPAIAGRQLYIGAWRYTWLDPRKRLRRERLAANAAVVRGSLAPHDAEDASSYPRAYALLAPHDPMPPGAALVASGRRFRLVRLR